MARVRASAAACVLLLLVVVAVARPAAAALNPAVLAGLPPLSPGEASVSSAKELLQALEDGVGDITLEGEAGTRSSTAPHWLERAPTALATAAWSRRSPLRCARRLRRRLCAGQIVLTPADWEQYNLPIELAVNATVLIHWSELRHCGCSRQRPGHWLPLPAWGRRLPPPWPQLHALTNVYPVPVTPLLSPAADDYSGLGLRPVTLDWGYAMNLIDMPEGSTLAFDGINSKSVQSAAACGVD